MTECPLCGRVIELKAGLLKSEVISVRSALKSKVTSARPLTIAKAQAETEDWGEYETLEIQREGASPIGELF